MGITACGLAIIFSLIVVFLPSSSSPNSHIHHYHSRAVSFVAAALALIAFLALGIVSAIVTVIMVKATDLVNQHGNAIGLYAYQGGKFLAITWSATTLMLLAVLSWVGVCCLGRRARRREWAEKPTGGKGWRG
jgi:heme/copper-type cytochrome/quinol oxidase subunit 2